MSNDLDRLESKIVQWHHDKGIIHGASNITQAAKMLEEVIELIAAVMPGCTPDEIADAVTTEVIDLLHRGKIKSVSEEDAAEAIVDAIGDIHVVGTNILEREGVSRERCLTGVYDIISKRTGKIEGGSFVKDE